jgi:hypothetical protein
VAVLDDRTAFVGDEGHGSGEERRLG